MSEASKTSIEPEQNSEVNHFANKPVAVMVSEYKKSDEQDKEETFAANKPAAVKCESDDNDERPTIETRIMVQLECRDCEYKKQKSHKKLPRKYGFWL